MHGTDNYMKNPKTRYEIRENIKRQFGGLADYCVERGFKYTVVTNLLRGFTPPVRHPEIVQRINQDLGCDAAAWGAP